jgi:hypothetical protein
MDTLKKAKEKYKTGTEIIDLAVVLMNKAMSMINNKVLSNAERTNKEIAAGNLDKLKQFGPAYVEMLKNYMTITSTLNLLVANSHAANYERKMILRAAIKFLDKKKEDDKKADYLLGKIMALEKHIDGAVKEITTLSHAIIPIAGGSDSKPAKSSKKSPEPTNESDNMPEIRNLKGVATVLTTMSQKLETSLSEIRLINKSVINLVPKKGSYEHRGGNDDLDIIRTAAKTRLVKAEVNSKNSKSKVKIIGGAENDDIYIGGAALDSNLEKKAVWVEMYNKDKLDRRDNPSYAELLNGKLLKVFAVGSSEEMEQVVGMNDDAFLSKIKKDCGLDSILGKQVEGILTGRKLHQLLAYYVKHRNIYAPSKTELKSESFLMSENDGFPANTAFSAISFHDDYLNLNMTLTENATVDEKVQYIVSFVRAVMDALEKVDNTGIVKQAINCIERINDITSSEQLQIAMDDLTHIMGIVESQSELLLERKRIKTEIRQLLDAVDEPEGIISRPVKPTLPQKGSGIGEMANYLLEKQLVFKPLLGAVEQTCNDQANTLGDLFRKIELLISSENKDTCLMKAIMFVNACVYTEVIPKLLKKRFDKESTFKENVAKYSEYLQGVAKPPKLYKKELMKDNVLKLAYELVGVESASV